MLANEKLQAVPARSRRALPILPSRTTLSPEGAFISEETAPPWFHLLGGGEPLVFIVEGSRLFTVEAEFFAALKNNPAAAEVELAQMLSPLPPKPEFSDLLEIQSPSAISLNVAQNCNLSCSYCYADEGRFGGKASLMTNETAFAAIDNLLTDAGGKTVTVGFIGGEPFLNRRVLHAGVAYASQQAELKNARIRFSVTTNGTLLQTADIELLRENAFTVTVSLDGDENLNNRFRRSRGGGCESSFGQAVKALAPLLQDPGRARVSARATVTREDLRVWKRIEALADAGFTDIGVSPLRDSPNPDLALTANDWAEFLREMVRAGENELQRVRRGETLRFSNFTEALRQIHRGANRSLPCGSTVNYVSVSSTGEYFTCHRTIDKPQFALGNLDSGLSQSARREFLRERQVERQQPCTSCWARRLCGGGCHAEVLSVGRGGCDYIRGWLEFCLRAYDRLLTENPSFFNF